MDFIYPSILSADFSNLKEQIRVLEDNKIKVIHIDIMDGKFVPNISFGFPVLKCIRDLTNLKLDVHLMIDEPIRYINDFINNGADFITVHIEGNNHIHRIIQQIKDKNIKVGIAINPGTSISTLIEVLPLVDLVLVMGVNPGFGGQKFIETTLNKINELKRFKNENNLLFDINIDGGIKNTNFSEILEAGADNLIVGSDIFKNGYIKSNLLMYK